VSVTASPAASTRTWVVTTSSGEAVSGYLPGWAEHDPSTMDVAMGRLPAVLADITHHADLGGLIMPVARAQEPAQNAPVLAVSIQCKPFPEDGDPHIPVVNVQVTDDFWISDLDPAAVTDLGQRLRTLGERLVTTVAPTLATARTDWTHRHRTPGGTHH
jgi:hypothetical protein